jgi:hypothetical protein
MCCSTHVAVTNVMLGFDTRERLIPEMPPDFGAKIVWGPAPA